MVLLKKRTTGKEVSLCRPGPLEKQLLKESATVADDSMKVLREFETFEEELPFDGPRLGGDIQTILN